MPIGIFERDTLSAAVVRKPVYYMAEDGVEPVREWLDQLKRKKRFVEYSKISTCIDRAALGNFGKHRFLGGDVGELKIDYGPGYRIYFGLDGDELIVLLNGGSKENQQADIETSKARWKKYLDMKKGVSDGKK